MPYPIPPFAQYQAQLVPIRCKWRSPPPEGDLAISCEIDWTVTTNQPSVQISLSGNSPVAISQIIALYIDNGRNSAVVSCQFPDSSVLINVPAFAQALVPVFTNALMFYVSSKNAVVNDMTVIQIFNFNPPPVQLLALAAKP